MSARSGAESGAMTPAEVLARSQHVVIKVGSSLVSAAGEVRCEWLHALAHDVAGLVEAGKQVTLVSSGAVALGRADQTSPQTLADKQACAAIGQVALSSAWSQAFASVDLVMAQVLLTPADTEHRRRHLNARATLSALHSRGAIAVINENDTVATEELRYGDNDQLAARVAQMIGADCVLLLSDVDGLMTAAPDSSIDASVVEWLPAVSKDVLAMAGGSVSGVGTGGMRSKLEAAQRATRSGATVIIANGRCDHPVAVLQSGSVATVIAAQSDPGSARRRWIAGMVRTQASVRIDSGAVNALKAGRSLLDVGVIEWSADFELGDSLSVQTEDGTDIGVGLAGISSTDIQKTPGGQRREPLIHRDNLVLHKDSDA
ncbi:MAG: glutamate 5-kinase [Pseudomonadota bacterium]